MRCYYRILTLAALILAGPATAGWSQVAAPELASGLPRLYNSAYLDLSTITLIPDNPAALQLSGKSKVSASSLSGSSESATNGSSVSYSGSGFGITYVAKTISMGLEKQAHQVAYSSVTFDESGTNFALAMLPAKWLTFGIGYKLATFDAGGSENLVESATYGVTLRMGSSFLMGFALSQDDFEQATFSQEGERTGLMFGIGVLTGKKSQWHIELSYIDKGDFVSLAGVNYFGGYTRTMLLIELVNNGILYGLSSFSLAYPSVDQTTSGFTLDFGLIQKGGLTLLLRSESITTTVPTGSNSDAIIALQIGTKFGKGK